MSTATESGDAIQIAYSVPVVNIMAWFRNHYKKGSVLGRFPRWGFSLASRTGAFDDEHKFPSNLDGAVVSKVCEKSKSNLKTGDVLVSINRGTEAVLLDKFGSITDKQHGDPKFSIMNSGSHRVLRQEHNGHGVAPVHKRHQNVPVRARTAAYHGAAVLRQLCASPLRSFGLYGVYERHGGFHRSWN